MSRRHSESDVASAADLTPIGLVASLARKYRNALHVMAESRDALEEFTSSSDPVRMEEWTRQMEEALASRDSDKSAMDIFEARIKKCECVEYNEYHIDLMQISAFP